MAMEFSGEYRIHARRQKVWDALNDPAVLQACIAGCSRLERISDTEMVATLVGTVGPISVAFKVNVVLSKVNAPIGYTLTAQGQGGAAGFARIEVQVSLLEDQNDTVLKYVATSEIGGNLVGIGNWLAQAVAQENADGFFAALAHHLGAITAREAAVPAALSAPSELLPVAVLPTAAEPTGKSSAPGPPKQGWLVLFACALGFALGYCFARFF